MYIYTHTAFVIDESLHFSAYPWHVSHHWSHLRLWPARKKWFPSATLVGRRALKMPSSKPGWIGRVSSRVVLRGGWVRLKYQRWGIWIETYIINILKEKMYTQHVTYIRIYIYMCIYIYISCQWSVHSVCIYIHVYCITGFIWIHRSMDPCADQKHQ